MNDMKRLFLAAGLALAASPVRAIPPAVAQLQDAFASVADKARPAVVNIQVTQERRVRAVPQPFFFGDPFENPEQFFGQPREYRYHLKGVGSGVIVSAEGLVLTNEHVVHDASQIEVTLTQPDGKQITLPGKVVGTDPGLDLAVVRIQAKGPFPSLKLGNSSKARVGDFVIAIGSPFELQQTVTTGILSANRQSLDIEGHRYPNMLQTDAAINRGNSGGPLLNLDAEVIGINTAIFSPTGASAGIGFAVPSDEIKEVLGTLEAGKRPQRGWLGIQVIPVDDVIQRRFGLPDKNGALVNSVFKGSPAESAGLKRGDVIKSFGGAPVASPEALIAQASKTPPNKKVSVGIIRAGKEMDLSLKLAGRPEWAERGEPMPEEKGPAAPEGAQSSAWQGVTVGPSGAGVVVTSVQRDSKLAGYLQEGDVIQGLNQTQVKSMPDWERATKTANLREGVVFDIVREGQSMYISVQMQ
jgi:serine protease Do